MNDETKKKAPTLWDVAKSSKNYERDFQHGKPSQYIIVGLIAVAIFISLLIVIVNLVLKLAGV